MIYIFFCGFECFESVDVMADFREIHKIFFGEAAEPAVKKPVSFIPKRRVEFVR